jgi:hypothetical protein
MTQNRPANGRSSGGGVAEVQPVLRWKNISHLLRIWDSLQLVEHQLDQLADTMFAMLTCACDDIKVKGAAGRSARASGRS